jgi:hypothetical protein
MADRFSDRSAQEVQSQDSNSELNWLNLERESRNAGRTVASAGQSNMRSSPHDPFFSHKQDEPYPGYNDQLAADRRYINASVNHLAEVVEKGLGFGIGSWGIWAEKFRGSGKYLSKLEYKVNLTPTPSAEQAERLGQIKTQIDNLAFAGRSTGAAVLKKEQEELEKMILQRSKIISTGGLALGIWAEQAVDQLIFHRDSPGDGTFCADVIAAPALAWMVPKNIALKSGAILGAHLAGKLYDRWLQPSYLYNPKDENQSTLPTTEINQFRSPFASLSKTPPLPEAEPLVWPQAASSQGVTQSDSDNKFEFNREDIEVQQANRERQIRDLEN